MGKFAISPASAKLKSSVLAEHVYSGESTNSLDLDETTAIDLATYILSVARNKENANGLIRITSHKKDNRVTIIRDKK